MYIFLAILAIIIIAVILGIILLVKNKNQDIDDMPNTEKEEVEEPVDVSNIVDSTVIEGASRDMQVLNEEDAKKILSEMYIKAMDTYSFNFDTEESNGDTKIKLVGYEELMNNVFTKNGIKQFEEYYKDIIVKEGKNTYITNSSVIKETLDYTFNFTKKEILENQINATVDCTYQEKNNLDKKFCIVKKDGIWKVESFEFPN